MKGRISLSGSSGRQNRRGHTPAAIAVGSARSSRASPRPASPAAVHRVARPRTHVLPSQLGPPLGRTGVLACTAPARSRRQLHGPICKRGTPVSSSDWQQGTWSHRGYTRPPASRLAAVSSSEWQQGVVSPNYWRRRGHTGPLASWLAAEASGCLLACPALPPAPAPPPPPVAFPPLPPARTREPLPLLPLWLPPTCPPPPPLRRRAGPPERPTFAAPGLADSFWALPPARSPAVHSGCRSHSGTNTHTHTHTHTQSTRKHKAHAQHAQACHTWPLRRRPCLEDVIRVRVAADRVGRATAVPSTMKRRHTRA